MIKASKPFSSSEWFKVKLSGFDPESGGVNGKRFTECSRCSAIAVVACNKTFVVSFFTTNSSVIAFSNDKDVVGGNFVVDGHVVMGDGGVRVQVQVVSSGQGSVSVEILRPQYVFIIGIFARVNSWTGFVAIVVSNASFKISNSSSV